MRTQKVMKSINSYLTEKYGAIPKEWELTLGVLENTIDRYLQVKASIDQYGIYDQTIKLKNPLLSTEKDLLATIMKLTQKIGITPIDYAKLLKAETSQEDDNEEDLIESLTNE